MKRRTLIASAVSALVVPMAKTVPLVTASNWLQAGERVTNVWPGHFATEIASISGPGYQMRLYEGSPPALI